MSELSLQDAFARALASHQSGRLEEAEALYRRVIEREPRHTGALTLLGTLEAQLRHFEKAAHLLEISLDLEPRQVNALYNRGIVLEALERFEEAVATYDRAIAIRGDSPEMFNNRGNALARLRRFDESIASYDRALALKPDYADAIRNRGNSLVEAGRFEEALSSYDRAVALDPRSPILLNNRGNVLLTLARRKDALESFDRALALEPDYAEALSNRGDVLSELGRYEEALDSFTRAVSLSRDQARALPYAEGHIACIRLRLCDWSAYEDTAARVVNGVLTGNRVLVPFGSYMLQDSAPLQHHCARMFVKDHSPPSPHPVWQGERYAHDRIRVAYVSFDFREHLLAHQFAGVIEHHDRSRFETTALSLYPKASGSVQGRLRNAFEHFIDVSGHSDVEAARLVRQLEVDLLVDLMGHTRGARMGLFALRPAPIQVSFNGPGTTGAEYIHYIIGDRIVIPPEHHPYFTEKVVYLPDTVQPNDATRPVAGPPVTRLEAGLPERGFVFCSFNTSYKFRPHVFDVWMRLLRETEGSVLWLASSNPVVIGNLRREAHARGVHPERLIFAPRVERMEDHLARQKLADLFLDTLPYNAQTTASDALWAGLPVLTCLGGAMSGRIAASVLAAIGLAELITHSLAEYEALALSLARDPGRLQKIRDTLDRNRTTHPLFDTARYTRHLEAVFQQMYERHRKGEAPDHFAVAPIAGTPAQH